MADEQHMNLQQALQKFASDLATKLEHFVEDTTQLEVRTFTTDTEQQEIAINQRADDNAIATAGMGKLRAYTLISLDGDCTVLVPTDAQGNVNQVIWDLHQVTVKQAQENRAAMFKALGEAAGATLKALGVTR